MISYLKTTVRTIILCKKEVSDMASEYEPVRVSTKGQVVIPLAIRRRLGIKLGERLVIVGGENEAILMKAKRYAESLRGMGGGIYGTSRESIDAYVRGERQTWRR